MTAAGFLDSIVLTVIVLNRQGCLPTSPRPEVCLLSPQNIHLGVYYGVVSLPSQTPQHGGYSHCLVGGMWDRSFFQDTLASLSALAISRLVTVVSSRTPVAGLSLEVQRVSRIPRLISSSRQGRIQTQQSFEHERLSNVIVSCLINTTPIGGNGNWRSSWKSGLCYGGTDCAFPNDQLGGPILGRHLIFGEIYYQFTCWSGTQENELRLTCNAVATFSAFSGTYYSIFWL